MRRKKAVYESRLHTRADDDVSRFTVTVEVRPWGYTSGNYRFEPHWSQREIAGAEISISPTRSARRTCRGTLDPCSRSGSNIEWISTGRALPCGHSRSGKNDSVAAQARRPIAVIRATPVG